jgi:hypothetical protein
MSVPFSTICCDGCALEQPGYITFGQFVYSDGPFEAPLRRGYGFCQSCDAVVAMEVLPTDQDLVLKQPEPAPTPNWGRRLSQSIFGQKAHPPQEDNRSEVAVLQSVSDLQRDPVCLTCGSSDCFDIPARHFYRGPRTTHATSVFHPGCGGRFLIRSSDGLRIALRMKKRSYDIHGQLLREDDA